jgi:hypothetical protein
VSFDMPNGRLPHGPALKEPFELFGVTPLLRRLPALVVTGLFLGVGWFSLGSDLNVPALFYHEAFGRQFANAVAATLLIVYAWLVTFIVDMRLGPDPAAPSEASWLIQFAVTIIATAVVVGLNVPFDGLLRWLTVPVLYLLVARGLLLFVPVESRLDRGIAWLIGRLEWCIPSLTEILPQWDRLRTGLARTAIPFLIFLALAVVVQPLKRLPMFFGVLAGWALFCATLAAAQLLARWTKRRLGNSRVPETIGGATPREEIALMRFAQAVFGLLVLVFAISALWNHFQFPPVLAVCLLLALIAGANAAVWFHLRRWAPLAFCLIGLALVLCNGQPYRVRFAGLDPHYDAPVPIAVDEEPEVSLDGLSEAALADEYARVLRLCARLHQRLEPRTLEEWNADLQKRAPAYGELVEEYQRLLKDMDDREIALLEGWRAATESATGEVKPKIVLVATSGGANRSSLWTAVVLKRLEDELKSSRSGPLGSDFPRHIRLITGASGGMVGAAHYVVTLGPAGHPSGFSPRAVADDYLTPILNATAFREAPLLFVPVANYESDRGYALEAAMERTTPDLKQSFANLDQGEREGWRPSLVFSPMIVEDGRRLIVSNRMLPYLADAEGSLLLGKRPLQARTLRPSVDELKKFMQSGDSAALQSSDPEATRVRQPRQRYDPQEPDRDVYSRSAIELFRLFPDARASFRVSTAARMNASFPYVSPAVDLPTDPPRRVVDAGYYDNYGVNLAARWMLHHAPWLQNHTSGVVLIQIRDTPSEYLRRHLHDPDEPLLYDRTGARQTRRFLAQVQGGWQWLTSPISGATAARWSVTSFRNDELVEEVGEALNAFRQEDEPPFFTTVVFERPGSDIGMNWYLTSDDIDTIVNAFDKPEDRAKNPNRSALVRLKDWWQGEKPPAPNVKSFQFRPAQQAAPKKD